MDLSTPRVVKVDEKMESFRLRKGPYRGDVSALCLISAPSHRRLLLAGTGPHLLLYDILTRTLLSSIDAFDGVRVHGICCGSPVQAEMHPISSKYESRLSTVLVHGERRVKVFQMVCLHRGADPYLKLWQSLPRFSHWVMDVRLLPNNHAKIQTPRSGGAEEVMLVAVGLSNNTICLWDLPNSVILYRVECSERLLLYSMRLWGESPDSLLAGVGTIFNEVLIWRLGPQVAAVEDASRRLTLLKKEAQRGEQVLGEISQQRSTLQVSVIEEVVEPLQRLLSHEGSIYRLTWSTDGLTLVSVSDDRSARVWHSGDREEPSCNQWVAPAKDGPVLYGHGARLWDCHVSDKLLITASEDCTCRIWTTDGKCLATLKGHQGRGIWRCVYDPDLDLVATAGADSSIKIQYLDKCSKGLDTDALDQDIGYTAGVSQSKQEVFTIDPVWSEALANGSGYLDSKSEYVRCLRLSEHCSLYVGTNQGYVYHVQISKDQKPTWTTLVDDLGAPVICMDVLVLQRRNDNLRDLGNHPSDNMVVVGDGKGNVTALRVRTKDQKPCVWRCTWAAEIERQLLEVFWCKPLEGRSVSPSMFSGRAQLLELSKSLESSAHSQDIWPTVGIPDPRTQYVVTADPKGTFLLWRLPSSDCRSSTTSVLSRSSVEYIKVAGNDTAESAVLLAQGKCAHGRVVCIDICLNQEFLVCGDKQGSLTLFSFPKILLDHSGEEDPLQSTRDARFQLQIVSVLKGAHGISTVTNVSFVTNEHGGQTEILTTGRDGCVCRFHLENHLGSTTPQILTCIGVEKVVAVSMLESLENCTPASSWTNSERKVAVGFTGSDFLLWDTTYNSELLRVTCGGWRRPFSYIVGKMADVQHAYVFVKGQGIQVHRNWVSSSGASFSRRECDSVTQSLRSQFHGREINSVLIFASPKINQSVTIATGAEDGTVILSSYLEGLREQLDPELVLGDHVGGSAVRSLALISEVHYLGTPSDGDPDLRVNKDSSSRGAVESCNSGHFLFSAGAKEVLTCWRLDSIVKNSDFQGSNVESEIIDKLSPLASEKREDLIAQKSFKLTSQWLSTRMLQRKRPPTDSADKEDSLAESAKLSSLVTRLAAEGKDLKNRKIATSKMNDDDHRYLAMTAFAVTCAETRNLVCFVVTASSNATLAVHAFHVATRSWIEVATLDYGDAPVLTIEHIVAPCSGALSGHGNTYVVLTGATNGNIAFWDLTTTVVRYMNSDGLDVIDVVPSSLRPLTGRGSQGGRRRKTREELKLAKKSKARAAKPEDYNLKPDSDSMKQVSNSGGDTKFSDTVNLHLPSDSSERGSAVEEQSHEKKAVLENILVPPVLSCLQEIGGAHQSGVNCMSVAKLQLSAEIYSSNAEMVYIVISGGDDQTIHLTTIKLVAQEYPFATIETEDSPGNNKLKDIEVLDKQSSPLLKCLSRSTISCAHSSAVKGIWTDGSWVFSTGLDQRLRCWKITTEFCNDHMNLADSAVEDSKGPESLSPLVECMTCVVDTPEPASLHVSSNSPGKYQIAVVGRGSQVINFDSRLTLR